jgi:parvulin-like peptidyl-prolyl isomerase
MAALPLAVAADVRVVEEIAAKVNGDIVTRGELDEQKRELDMFLRQERHLKGVELADAEQVQSKNFLRDKIDQLLMVQKAKDLNLNVDSEVAKRLAEMQVMAKITDPEKFHDFVRDNTGMPFEEYKQKMSNDFLVHRLVGQEIGSHIAIPEPELRKFYDAHQAQFVRKAQVFLSQILISTEGKTPEQAAAAEAKAKDVSARARKGEKFTDLVAAFSDDKETATAGGSLPPRERGMSLPEIEEFAFKQKKGSVSDPIKIATGLVILRLDERYEAGQASFDEVKEQIQEIVAGPQIETKVRAFLTKLRFDAFLEVKEGYVDAGAAPGKDTHWHDIAQPPRKPWPRRTSGISTSSSSRFREPLTRGAPSRTSTPRSWENAKPRPPRPMPPHRKRRPRQPHPRRRPPRPTLPPRHRQNNEVAFRQRTRSRPVDQRQFRGPLEGDSPEEDRRPLSFPDAGRPHGRAGRQDVGQRGRSYRELRARRFRQGQRARPGLPQPAPVDDSQDPPHGGKRSRVRRLFSVL